MMTIEVLNVSHKNGKNSIKDILLNKHKSWLNQMAKKSWKQSSQLWYDGSDIDSEQLPEESR